MEIRIRDSKILVGKVKKMEEASGDELKFIIKLAEEKLKLLEIKKREE